MIFEKIKYIIDNLTAVDEFEKNGLLFSRRSFMKILPAAAVIRFVPIGPSPLRNCLLGESESDTVIQLRSLVANINYSIFDLEVVENQPPAFLTVRDLNETFANEVKRLNERIDRDLWVSGTKEYERFKG